MNKVKFDRLQGYVRRAYSKIMSDEFGSQFCYTVEWDRGTHVEVALYKSNTRTQLGGTIEFHRQPKPASSKAAVKDAARIRNHIISAHALDTLLNQ